VAGKGCSCDWERNLLGYMAPSNLLKLQTKAPKNDQMKIIDWDVLKDCQTRERERKKTKCSCLEEKSSVKPSVLAN